MNLSEPFIRRPVMTALLTVSCILFGVMAYLALPVNDLPVVDYPVISVQVSYPGASPQTMAANVATPLERQFMQISGLELVTSSSGQGHTSFTLQFSLDKSIDAAATDVQTAITQATGKLPTDLPSPPTFTKQNPNDQPVLYVALASSTFTAGQLYDYGTTQVGQRISILKGVSKVDVYGTQSAVRIKADPSALAARGMTIEDLVTGVQQGTTYQGAGQIDGPHQTDLLQPQGQLTDASQYDNQIIGVKNRQPIYLRDVARAIDSVQDERVNMRFWARNKDVPTATVVVAVYRQAGANAVEVAQSVHELMPIVRQQLPPSVIIMPVYDRSVSIQHSVMDVKLTLLIAFILVVLVIFAFLGRATDTLIPAVALPLSLLLTFIVMSMLGYSLDNLSLMALTLAIGFLVDDAIVFLENTVRRMEHGENALQASLNSAKEISFTILAMTISLAAVFIPLVFMPGLVGRIFREFAITIVVAIFASGLVSLTLTPLMCARLLRQRGVGVKKNFLERTIGAVEHRVLNVYGRSLWWFLRFRWISLATWLICLGGTVYLFILIPKAFLPVGDSSFIRGVMIAKEGSSPQQMRQYQLSCEQVMHNNPNVDMTFTMTGNSNFLASNMGFLLAFLKDPDQRVPTKMMDMQHPGQMITVDHPTIDQVTQQLTGGIFMTTPGIIPALQPNPVLQISTGATANNQGRFAYAISGVNPEEVYATAEKMMAKLSTWDGFPPHGVSSDFFNHTPNLQINILRDQAALYGVSAKRIESLLSSAFSQNYVYLIKRANDQYQVIVEAADQDRREPDNLDKLYVRSDDGKSLVPLNAVATWKQVPGPQSVNHINQFTSVTLYFNLKPGVAVGDATDFVERTAAETVPLSMRGSLQGEALTFKDTVHQLTLLMLLAVFVMYVILGILYESYLHPITVLSSLPVALVGGLVTLMLFGQEASLYAFVGMFMLMGIVKKNGIMIVDFAIQRVNAGQSAVQSIHDASMDRFRPIIMTTMAAVMGAVPIALGFGADAASRRPLGLVIVGGLIVSQFITLYITPVIYLYLEDFQEKVLDKTSLFRSHRAHAAEMPAPLPVAPMLPSKSAHAASPRSQEEDAPLAQVHDNGHGNGGNGRDK